MDEDQVEKNVASQQTGLTDIPVDAQPTAVAFSAPEPSDRVKEIAEQISQPVPEGQTMNFPTVQPKLSATAQATLNALRPKR
jgi:hypothetical protein